MQRHIKSLGFDNVLSDYMYVTCHGCVDLTIRFCERPPPPLQTEGLCSAMLKAGLDVARCLFKDVE
jgi:hypothetical protein